VIIYKYVTELLSICEKYYVHGYSFIKLYYLQYMDVRIIYMFLLCNSVNNFIFHLNLMTRPIL